MTRPAVALLIFNRPALTERVFEAVAAARPPLLLVVGDGPRQGHPEDPELVVAARAVIERVDWPCEVRTCFAEENLGCGVRIATGLDWVFQQVEEAIILEDDCLPDPTFFPFCEQMLDRFAGDERVHMVSGTNVMEPDPFPAHSYCFSRGYHIWGWATWARAWRHYDFEMRAWPALRDTDWLERHLGTETGARVARTVFDATYEGRIRQWDFQWVLCGWLADAVAVVPKVNLVRNIGYGEQATHMRDAAHRLAALPARPLGFPLRHPPEVEVLEERDRAMWASADAEQRGTRQSAVESMLRRGARLLRSA